MRDTAGRAQQVTGSGLEHLVAELDAEAAFQYVGVLVLVVVGVERSAQRPGGEWVLDQAERAPRAVAADHAADPAGGRPRSGVSARAVRSASIMKRTPRASSRSTSPWSGPSRWVTPVGIVGPLSIGDGSIDNISVSPPVSNIT